MTLWYTWELYEIEIIRHSDSKVSSKVRTNDPTQGKINFFFRQIVAEGLVWVGITWESHILGLNCMHFQFLLVFVSLKKHLDLSKKSTLQLISEGLSLPCRQSAFCILIIAFGAWHSPTFSPPILCKAMTNYPTQSEIKPPFRADVLKDSFDLALLGRPS